MIELKSLSGSYGAGTVEDVSIRLPNGKMYGVFSPCYADSVALLALISGARTPTAGTVLVGGFDLHREAKQARRGIGYLPADLFPDEALTPIEYLMAVANTRDLPYEKTLRHVHDFLEIAGLEKKKECLISNLSYGEKRALCLLQLLGILWKMDYMQGFAKTHQSVFCYYVVREGFGDFVCEQLEQITYKFG